MNKVNKGPVHGKINRSEPPKGGYSLIGKAPLSGIDLNVNGLKIKEIWSSAVAEQLNQNHNMGSPKLKDIFIDKKPKKGKMKNR